MNILRQTDLEICSFAESTVHLYYAAMRIHHGLDNCQAQAGTLDWGIPSSVHPVEFVEYPGQILLLNTYAVVIDLKADIIFLFIYLYQHPSLFPVIFDGIPYKIVEDLFHADFASRDKGRVLLRFEGESDFFLVSRGFQAIHAFQGYLGQIDVLEVLRHFFLHRKRPD